MDAVQPCQYQYYFNDISELTTLLTHLGATLAVLKILPKNANDKNQVRIAANLNILHPTFALTFNERGTSSSTTKRKSDPNKRIPEATFDSFHWLTADKRLIQAKNLKAIFYAQYPEARLSGFQTIDNNMPRAMSIEYSKQTNAPLRILVIARLPGGAAIGIMIVAPSIRFQQQFSELDGFYGSSVCKNLLIKQDSSSKLAAMLQKIIGNTYDGCRNDKFGNKIPFTGTQVCGYTLEQTFGIIPNSDKNGDIFGIELKAHTQKKVTLFTPEPDFGLYKEDYAAFMQKFGYPDSQNNWRFTGIHKANQQNLKSTLTLKVTVKKYIKEKKLWLQTLYDPQTCSTSKMQYFEVILVAPDGEIAAGWSHERLMNSWGAKHNEVVYVPASKHQHNDDNKRQQGYEYQVTFGSQVMWCRGSSTDRLFRAIHNGTIFLDPAPKLNLTDPSKNKRRSQWRVNDITSAAHELYDEVLFTRC